MRRLCTLFLSLWLVLSAATPFCAAADYDFKTMTPQIEQALKNRQARYYQLQGLKREGLVGENNKGYVTDLKNNSSASTLVTAENKDRRVLYEALAEQNMLGASGLLEIERAFAEVQSEKAEPGDMVQSSSGAWERKK